jgi:hypothetical protein
MDVQFYALETSDWYEAEVLVCSPLKIEKKNSDYISLVWVSF